MTAATIGVLLGASLVDPAFADQYFNCAGSEAAINGNPSTLMCDDFEDGNWYVTNELNGGGGRSNPINDGWLGHTFAPLDATGQGYARCGLLGATGTNCTATHAIARGKPEALHYFAPAETVYNEI